MSNWVYVTGIIKINFITEKGIKNLYGLKRKKDIKKFYQNSNNWPHKFDDDYLILDHTDAVKKFFENIETPFGSEGHLEVEPTFYNRFLKIPGVKSSSCSASTQDYNKKTGELIPFGYELDISKEKYEKDGWTNVWFEENASNFAISVFGSLRDSSLDRFNKEFNAFLNEISLNFVIDDIFVKASECWTCHESYWRYDNDNNEKIFYEI